MAGEVCIVVNDDVFVFVVDEDAAARDAAGAVLRSRFPQTEFFGDIDSMLRRFVAGRAVCVLADLLTQAPGGVSPIRYLKQQGIDVPVIACSTNAGLWDVVQAFREGATDFVQKPFSEVDLLGAVTRAAEAARRIAGLVQLKTQVQDRLNRLSPGEREVLELLLQGFSNREMAAQLNISVRTVEDRRARLMRKMAADSLAEMVQKVTLAGFKAEGIPAANRQKRPKRSKTGDTREADE